MNPEETKKLEAYFKKTFGLKTLEIRKMPKKKDSVELYVNDEFVGVIYRDDEDGEVSYQFQMAILSEDL